MWLDLDSDLLGFTYASRPTMSTGADMMLIATLGSWREWMPQDFETRQERCDVMHERAWAMDL
jgi:hypothetical protein